MIKQSIIRRLQRRRDLHPRHSGYEPELVLSPVHRAIYFYYLIDPRAGLEPTRHSNYTFNGPVQKTGVIPRDNYFLVDPGEYDSPSSECKSDMLASYHHRPICLPRRQTVQIRLCNANAFSLFERCIFKIQLSYWHKIM